MAPKVYRETRTLTREFIKWDNGKRVKMAPDQYTMVELEIDIDSLFSSIGAKAARSKGGRSVEAGGLIIARRLRS